MKLKKGSPTAFVGIFLTAMLLSAGSADSCAEIIPLKNPTATFSQAGGWDVNLVTDGTTNDVAGWAIFNFSSGGAGPETAVFETETNIGFLSGTVLTFSLYNVNHNPQAALGRFRLSFTTDARDTFADGMNSGGDVTADWTVLAPTSAVATDGTVLSILEDGSVLASGANPEKSVYTIVANTLAQGITGFRLEALEDSSLPASGPGRAENGNFVLTELTASIAALERPAPPISPTPVSLKNTAASFSQVGGWDAILATDGITNDSAGWAVFDFSRSGAFPETLVVETEDNIGFQEGSILTFGLYHVNHNPQSGLGRFRISYTTDSRDSFADGLNTGGDVTATWSVLMPTLVFGSDGVTLSILTDGSVLADGANPSKTVYSISTEVDVQNITGFRLEALEDPALPAAGPGRSPNGNFVLTEFTVSIAPKRVIQAANYDLSRDFSPSINPGDVWSYGAKPSLSGVFAAFGIHGLNPFQFWQLVPSQEPTIFRNGTSNTITIADGQGVFAPGTTFLFSGTDGASNGFGAVRFTAPTSTNYLVETAVAPVYNGDLQGDTDYHVVKNGAPLFGRFLAPSESAGYTNIVGLNAGDTLDFIVGRGADDSGTGSGLKIEVRIVGTSESVPIASIPPPSGIVGWWPFDMAGRDIVGGNDGVLLGSPLFGDGMVGRSIVHDGLDDSVRVPADSVLNVGMGSGFTIEGWIYPTDLSQLRPIAEWNSGGIGAHFWTGVDIDVPGDGERSLFANIVDATGGNHQIRSSKNVIIADEWQHVALSYDKASGLAAIYHNGNIVTQANLGTFTPSTTGDLHFGNRPAGPFSGIVWKGKLDEMSLYNRALAASDIAGVFAAGGAGKIPPTNPPPVNHAPLAKVMVEPDFMVWPDQTNVMVIAVDGLAMDVVLDGSLSSDEDGNVLTHLWAKNDEGAPFASGPVVTNLLEVGFHTITLVVDDGKLTDSDVVYIEVLTLEDAVDELYGVLIESEMTRKDKRPLLATLDRVWHSIIDGRYNAAAKQLRAFQQKVRAQVAGKNVETGQRMVSVAQQIIDAINAYLEHHDEPRQDDKGKDRKR